jgi:hypothetical protein
MDTAVGERRGTDLQLSLLIWEVPAAVDIVDCGVVGVRIARFTSSDFPKREARSDLIVDSCDTYEMRFRVAASIAISCAVAACTSHDSQPGAPDYSYLDADSPCKAVGGACLADGDYHGPIPDCDDDIPRACLGSADLLRANDRPGAYVLLRSPVLARRRQHMRRQRLQVLHGSKQRAELRPLYVPQFVHVRG